MHLQLRSPRSLVSLAPSLLVAVLLVSTPACSEDAPVDPGLEDLAGADLSGLDLSAYGDLSGPNGLASTNDVTILVEPDDKSGALVAAINGATASVHMTMYLLTAQPVIDALVARKQAGKEVKVLLNKTFPSGMGTNATIYTSLMSAGVEVKWAPANFTYTHEKAVLIDGVKVFIMTMNATASAFIDNREYVAIDADAADVAEAESIFQADWAGTPISPSGKLLTAPVNAEARLIALVDQATTTLDVEAEVFSADSILQALGRADKRGVAVRVVLSDSTATNAQTQAVAGMKQVGIAVRQLKTPYVHAKAIVADGRLAYVGSINFTANSLQNNRELGLLVGKQTEVDKINTTFASDFAAATPL